jgi:hypothetical protein
MLVSRGKPVTADLPLLKETPVLTDITASDYGLLKPLWHC